MQISQHEKEIAIVFTIETDSQTRKNVERNLILSICN